MLFIIICFFLILKNSKDHFTNASFVFYSSFGKTLEQKRKKQNIRIVISAAGAQNLTKKPTVQNIIPINETTSIFVMKRLSVYLDKPIAVGSTIMDISKSVMFDMPSNCMKKYYKDRCMLLYTDTGKYIFLSIVNYFLHKHNTTFQTLCSRFADIPYQN
jgi:hypothetical protein